MKLLYIAGPFTHTDRLHGIERNILVASDAALQAWRAGWAVICPHKNTSGFQHVKDIPEQVWYDGDLEMLRRCDALMTLPGYSQSPGAKVEYQTAKDLGLPIFHYIPGDYVPRPDSIQ